MNMSSQVFNARRQRHHLLPIVVSLTALLSGCSVYMGDHKAVYEQEAYADHGGLPEQEIVIRKPHWMPDHSGDSI